MLSIVTITANNLSGFKKTCESVELFSENNQIEWIIVDGGDDVETPQFVARIKAPNVNYIRECDNGIFDAMNKGAKLCKGPWINFMNAGDWFENDFIFKPEVNTDLIIGKTRYNNIVRPLMNLSDIEKGLMIGSHQAMVYHKKIFDRGYFFSISPVVYSDFDHLSRLYQSGFYIKLLDVTIANRSLDGVSSKRLLKNTYSRYYYIVKNWGIYGFWYAILKSIRNIFSRSE